MPSKANLPTLDNEFKLFQNFIETFRKEGAERGAVLEGYDEKLLGSIDNLISQYAPEIREQFDFGKELRDIYKSQTLPQEQKLIKDLSSYDTPQRREQEAARAAGQVSTAADAQEKQNAQRLQAAGIDPNDPRFRAAAEENAPRTAALEATAANDARLRVEETGLARRGAAIDIGRGQAALGGQYSAEAARLQGQQGQLVGQAFQTSAGVLGTPAQYQQAQLSSAQSYIDNLNNRYDQRVARRAQSAAGSQALGASVGRIGGAIIGGYFGSAGGPAGTAAGASAGAQLGGSLFGG